MKHYYKYSLILLFIHFSNSTLRAQANDTTIWGKMPSLADLKMNTWMADTTAEAVVLNNDGIVVAGYGAKWFDFRESKRIKILKKSAFNRSNITIPYYTKDGYERLISIRARTWLPDGSHINVDEKSIVNEKLNDRWSVLKFTFPNVIEGAILEYEYYIESQNFTELREWYFQSDIPTRNSRFNFNVSARFSYTYLIDGKRNLKTIEAKPTRDERLKATFYTENLPSIQEEAYMSNAKNYMTRIRFQLVNVISLTGKKDEMLTTWENAVKELYKDDYFGKKFTKMSNFNDAWKAISNTFLPDDTEFVKLHKIYNFVNKITWDKIYTWGTNNSLNDVFQKQRGSSGEINLLLLALLREADLEANPVLISTREHGSVYEEYPFLDQFNHVLIHIKLKDGKILLLDGGNKNRTAGNLNIQSMNNRGCLITSKTATWINIVSPSNWINKLLTFELSKEGDLRGTVQSNYKGYFGETERDKYNRDKSGQYLQSEWVKEFIDVKLDSIQFSNNEDLNENFKISYKSHIVNAAQVTEDKIYLNPTMQTQWQSSPFKIKDRSFPVEIPYSVKESIVINIALPKGFQVEEMPKSALTTLNKEDAQFQYSISQSDNKIQLVILIRINKLVFQPIEYQNLKAFFDNISNKLKEQIVLKKIQ